MICPEVSGGGPMSLMLLCWRHFTCLAAFILREAFTKFLRTYVSTVSLTRRREALTIWIWPAWFRMESRWIVSMAAMMVGLIIQIAKGYSGWGAFVRKKPRTLPWTSRPTRECRLRLPDRYIHFLITSSISRGK